MAHLRVIAVTLCIPAELPPDLETRYQRLRARIIEQCAYNIEPDEHHAHDLLTGLESIVETVDRVVACTEPRATP
jgi:hypothetical protein